MIVTFICKHGKRPISYFLILTAYFAQAGILAAHAESIDTTINHYISTGKQFSEQLIQAQSKQQTLMGEKKQLDAENARLSKDQDEYAKRLKRHDKQTNEHKRELETVRKQCNQYGGPNRLEQLAKNADSAALSSGCSGFCNNGSMITNSAQAPGYVRHCNAKIAASNEKTLQDLRDTASLLEKNAQLAARTLNLNSKIFSWNQSEAQTVNLINDIYVKLNAWQQEVEAFMQSSEFQREIVQANASNICTTPEISGSPEQKSRRISAFIFGCLETVGNSRDHYYKHQRQNS